jgi:hypothetical protein
LWLLLIPFSSHVNFPSYNIFISIKKEPPKGLLKNVRETHMRF